MSERDIFLKKINRSKSQRFSTVQISQNLTSKLSYFSGSQSDNFDYPIKEKNKELITKVLSISKNCLMNGSSQGPLIEMTDIRRFKYPYKPNSYYKLNVNPNRTKLLISRQIYNFDKTIKYTNNLSSVESNLSTFRSSSLNLTKNNWKCNKKKNMIYSKIIKNKFSLNSSIPKPSKIGKIMLLDSNSIIKNNSEIELKNDNKTITGDIFLNYIEHIISDNSYINKFKNGLSEYFSNIFNKNELYILKELFDNYTFEEKNDENFFLKDFHSAKINNFIIRDLDVTFKLSSLKLMFYEISDDQKVINSKNFDNNSNGKEKYAFNSKIKFPFEFLSFFYGLDFTVFKNLLLAIIDYNFITNKFYIDYDNFKIKIEDYKILYDFFKEKCFANLYNSRNTKEYFLYNWDVKANNNKIKHFYLKMLLPQIKIKIKINNKKKNQFKFYSNVNIQTMNNLIKNSFSNWDFFILISFSENKLFRYEINKIISGKYSNSEQHMSYNYLKDSQYISYNLTDSITRINTLKRDTKSYSFFFTYFKQEKTDVYYIYFKLPQITISYKNFIKTFEVEFKELYQLNKLRKYFLQEDLIKYSMSLNIIQKKLTKEDIELKELLPMHTNTLNKRASSRISIEMKNKKGSVRQFLRNKRRKKKQEMLGLIPQLHRVPLYEEIIKDIDLNLKKTIFNFDESILKFIDFEDIHKNDVKDDSKIDDNTYHLFKLDTGKKKLNIDIDTLEINWTNREGLSKTYKLDKKISQFLCDFPVSKWRLHVENNIDKIIVGDPQDKRGSHNKKSFFKKRTLMV